MDFETFLNKGVVFTLLVLGFWDAVAAEFISGGVVSKTQPMEFKWACLAHLHKLLSFSM